MLQPSPSVIFFVQAPNCRPFIDEEGALFACSYYLELFFRQDPETGSSDTEEGPGKTKLFLVLEESAMKHKLHLTPDKLEAVTEDEDSNNTDEDSGNHKVSSLPPAQVVQLGTSGSEE